jgi:predicted kinase
MLLNIRGTNGSGKTTIANSLMLDERPEPVLMATQEVPAPTKRDPDRMRTREVWGTPCKYNGIILGTYRKSCGGCDEFSWKGSHDGMVQAIMWGMRHYNHVIFEGLTVTSSYQRYVDLARFAKTHHGWFSHWIMLTVPVEECIRRVGARNNRETTERVVDNVTKKNKTVLNTVEKLKQQIPAGHAGDPLGWTAFNTTEAATEYAHKLLETM